MSRQAVAASFAVRTVLLAAAVGSAAVSEPGTPKARVAHLSNGAVLPLVGLGVGNLAHSLIEEAVMEAVDRQGVQFIDTAAASKNERIISSSLNRTEHGRDVTVLTKVWYTHLGFERTILSVRSSLEQLGGSGRRPAVLLHWPRCRRDIPWMRCEQEEAELPEEVRKAGPAPHLDPEAWYGSWRALEKLYQEGLLSSIGVSNFDVKEMQALMDLAEVKPHILQGNVWSLVFDPLLMNLLKRHRVVFQAYNVMNGLFEQRKQSSMAYHTLKNVGQELGGVQTAQLVLGWLVQQGVSVVPRSSNVEHLRANSPASVAAVPALEPAQQEIVLGAVQALLRGDGDGAPNSAAVRAGFSNLLPEPVEVFWVNPQTGEEVPATAQIAPRGTAAVSTHPGHVFVARRSGRSREDEPRRFEVTAGYGGAQEFSIDMKGEL